MRIKIAYQIAVVYIVIMVLTTLVGVTTLRTVGTYNSFFEKSTAEYAFDLDLYKLRGLAQDQVRIAVQNVIANAKLLDPFNQRSSQANALIADLNAKANTQHPEYLDMLTKLSATYDQFTKGVQPAFQEATPNSAAAVQNLTQFITPGLDFVNNYTNYASSTNPLEAFIYQIDTLLANTDTTLLQVENQTRSAYNDVIQQLLVSSAITLIIVAILLFFLSRNIIRPINALLHVSEEIGKGNFDQRIMLDSALEMAQLGEAINTMAARLKTSRAESEDLANSERRVRERLERSIADYTLYLEKVGQRDLSTYLTIRDDGEADRVATDLRLLGDSLNKTVASLAAIASQSREIANSTASAAAEILAAVMSQVTGGNEQSRAVAELRTTMEKFRDVSRQTMEQAQGVTTMANRLQETVALGESAIEENVTSMDRVRTQTESIASSVLALSERTQAISQIISSVDDLAEQSKILALNAAIEAARAGEAGKSFAVVADEVRSLANQSRQATGRISEMLGEIQRATNKVVMTTEEGIKQVDSAVQLVRRAGEAIEALADSVARSSQVAQEILLATQQQTNGMGQMTEAMDNIERVTAQSVTAGLQTERAAHNLNEMAQRLQRSVEQYQL